MADTERKSRRGERTALQEALEKKDEKGCAVIQIESLLTSEGVAIQLISMLKRHEVVFTPMSPRAMRALLNVPGLQDFVAEYIRSGKVTQASKKENITSEQQRAFEVLDIVLKASIELTSPPAHAKIEVIHPTPVSPKKSPTRSAKEPRRLPIVSGIFDRLKPKDQGIVSAALAQEAATQIQEDANKRQLLAGLEIEEIMMTDPTAKAFVYDLAGGEAAYNSLSRLNQARLVRQARTALIAESQLISVDEAAAIAKAKMRTTAQIAIYEGQMQGELANDALTAAHGRDAFNRSLAIENKAKRERARLDAEAAFIKTVEPTQEVAAVISGVVGGVAAGLGSSVLRTGAVIGRQVGRVIEVDPFPGSGALVGLVAQLVFRYAAESPKLFSFEELANLLIWTVAGGVGGGVLEGLLRYRGIIGPRHPAEEHGGEPEEHHEALAAPEHHAVTSEEKHDAPVAEEHHGAAPSEHHAEGEHAAAATAEQHDATPTEEHHEVSAEEPPKKGGIAGWLHAPKFPGRG